MLSSPASTPILDFSPLTSLFAVSRHFTCPRCSMSKTPLVVTIFLFCFLSFRAIWASWLIVFILFFVIFNYPLCSINQVLCKIIGSYLIFVLYAVSSKHVYCPAAHAFAHLKIAFPVPYDE